MKASYDLIALFVFETVLVLGAIFVIAFGSGVNAILLHDLSVDTLAFDVQYQNVTDHVGDILVVDNESLLIQDCFFNQTGKLVVGDDAEVIIRNATFISNWDPNETPDEPYWRTKNVILQNQSRLTVESSVLILSANASYPRTIHCIILSDDASTSIIGSEMPYSDGLGIYIYCRNSSGVSMENTTISTFFQLDPYEGYPKSGLELEGESLAEVQNSTLDQITISETADSSGGRSNCTLSVDASKLELFETLGNDTSNVEFSSCNAFTLNIQGQDSNVRLTNTTVDTLKKNTNARLVIDNSSIQTIYVYDYSNMWVIWTLPLFGQVEIPYAWAPYVIPVTVTAVVIAVTVITLTLFLSARRKRKRKATATTPSIPVKTSVFLL